MAGFTSFAIFGLFASVPILGVPGIVFESFQLATYMGAYGSVVGGVVGGAVTPSACTN
jgi:hypothetical protein